MDKIKKGSVVKIKSSNTSYIYYVKNISRNRKFVLLKGITVRIETSSYLEDLELVEESQLTKILEQFEEKINSRTDNIIEKSKKDLLKEETSRKIKSSLSGTILHLDGDKQYAAKSERVYNKLGLNAVVKNIKESKQPLEIRQLLNRYNPDILIITGHDGMIKKGFSYNDIYNYRNSKYFVQSVIEARRWEQGVNKIAIFAGACQSYYEAIMEAGANFASSPARILIDFMDPLIIAQKIAITPKYKYITIASIRDELRNGERGISGIGSYGKNVTQL